MSTAWIMPENNTFVISLQVSTGYDVDTADVEIFSSPTSGPDAYMSRDFSTLASPVNPGESITINIHGAVVDIREILNGLSVEPGWQTGVTMTVPHRVLESGNR